MVFKQNYSRCVYQYKMNSTIHQKFPSSVTKKEKLFYRAGNKFQKHCYFCTPPKKNS